MAKGEYTISDIYQGGYSSFKPKYGDVFTGYRINAGAFGVSTDPRTANAMQDASTKVNMGIKQIELTFVSPEIFDAMPKQQLKELNQLSKLTGVGMSVHGPVMDSTGISQNGFSEMDRQTKERKMTDFLIRAQEVNPDKSTVMTFHSSEGIPGSEWKTLGDKEKQREARKIIAIDRDSGKMIPLEEEKKYYPTPKGLEIKEYTPEKNLEIINLSEWDNKISQLFFNKERADEILQNNQAQIQHLSEEMSKGLVTVNNMTPEQQSAYMKVKDAENYLNEIHRNANTLFSKAYEFGNEEQRKKLKQIADSHAKDIEEMTGREKNIIGISHAMHRLLNELQEEKNELTPTMFVPIEQFALEKSSQTFGNAAFNAYKKLGDKAPIVSIENPPAGHALSTGEDLRNLVEASRKQFAAKAMKEKGLGEREAEELAKKFIGATWDVGHINMLRKQGFEAKDIIKESEKIAPLVKHVHLSDNFGFEHTELPMGMGNVPTKEIFEKLGKQGFDAAKIIEAASWWQHFKAPPFKESLAAFGSPIYSMKAPYWNQELGFQQGYFSGYGMMLPQFNYETFGAGFSRLPPELGGQMQNSQGSRMSGRPME
jgi:sugar phosphate isomerase/epimerase